MASFLSLGVNYPRFALQADSRVAEEKCLLVVISITLDLRYEQAFLRRYC
jgi:hypothetical protein